MVRCSISAVTLPSRQLLCLFHVGSSQGHCQTYFWTAFLPAGAGCRCIFGPLGRATSFLVHSDAQHRPVGDALNRRHGGLLTLVIVASLDLPGLATTFRITATTLPADALSYCGPAGAQVSTIVTGSTLWAFEQLLHNEHSFS